MYLDSGGLIVQANGDGGDCLQREGFWNEGVFFNPQQPIPGLASYVLVMSYLDSSVGLVRYWKAPYNNPADTSRDQLVSNIRAWGYYNMEGFLNVTLQAIVKNLSRYPNGDWFGPQDYGRFVRAYKSWPLWPVLIFTDLQLLANVLLVCFWLTRQPGPVRKWLASKVSWLWWLTNQYPPNAEGVPQSPYGATNSSNDVNLIGDLQQAKTFYPTPISFLSRKIYKHFRPQGPQFALDSYFSAASGANTEFASLWKPIVSEF